MALIGGLPIFRIFEKSSDFDPTGWLVLTKSCEQLPIFSENTKRVGFPIPCW